MIVYQNTAFSVVSSVFNWICWICQHDVQVEHVDMFFFILIFSYHSHRKLSTSKLEFNFENKKSRLNNMSDENLPKF